MSPRYWQGHSTATTLRYEGARRLRPTVRKTPVRAIAWIERMVWAAIVAGALLLR